MKKLIILSIAASFIILTGCRTGVTDIAPNPYSTMNNESAVVSPDIAVTWPQGSKQVIKWEHFTNAKYVSVILMKKKQLNKVVIASRISNTGSVEWTVPDNIPSSHHYQIKIEDCDNSNSYIWSEVFYIM